MCLKPFIRSLFICCLIFFADGITQAQPFIREVETIPVIIGGDTVSQPFAGGINTPQHQFVDIDGDGDYDLFVFDADLSSTKYFFRNVGTEFIPKFKLERNSIVLPDFQSWFLFIDLNGDAKFELATDDSSFGIRYYRNDGTAQDPLFVLDTPPMRDSSNEIINAGFGNVPTFADINGDGLLDFFSNNGADGSINYYQNIGTPTSPVFKFITSSFQGIIVLGDQCTTSVNAKTALHGSGALTFFDIDADGTNDLFHGDQFFTGLFFMKNNGSASVPLIQCTSNSYPPLQPVSTFGFNQPNFVDIDSDGDADLFIGVLNNMFRHGFWFYENTGDATSSDFQLRTKDYLSMIDVGKDASPELSDFDNDGKLDLFIGNVNGQLWYFHNEGTQSQPAFVLQDTLFAGIKGNSSYTPDFLDADNDGDQDLFLGRFDGKVFLYKNTAGVLNATDSLNAGQFSFPAGADLDADGDVDLLVGKGNGQISYYRNDGTVADFSPLLITSSFSGIDVGENAKPVLTFDTKRRLYDLYIGNTEGALFYFKNMGDSTSPSFVQQTDAYGNIDPMRETSPAFGDLDNDSDLDMIVGTLKGGLHFYRNDFTSEVKIDPLHPLEFELLQNYPNPFNPISNFEFRISKYGFVTLKIYDLFGKEIASLVHEVKTPGTYLVQWDASAVASGVYFYRLQSGNQFTVKKLMLIK